MEKLNILYEELVRKKLLAQMHVADTAWISVYVEKKNVFLTFSFSGL